MKLLVYLLSGTFFGILLTKAEVISWFRIQEMFRFHSIHMYGVIGSAILVGAIGVYLLKKLSIKSWNGEVITFPKKQMTKGTYIGGIIFGLGWALTGACPGPLFTLIGSGYYVIVIVLISAILGTLTYGWIKNYLPH